MVFSSRLFFGLSRKGNTDYNLIWKVNKMVGLTHSNITQFLPNNKADIKGTQLFTFVYMIPLVGTRKE